MSSVKIPLDMLVCVTGVSGSGKSTLVHDVLYAGLKKKRGEWNAHVGFFKELKGRTSSMTSSLSTNRRSAERPLQSDHLYKGYDAIREVFAGTNAAKTKGYNASHFSFNVPGGRCEVCQGSGTVTIEMQFLADVELTCEDCRGMRFKSRSSTLNTRARTSTRSSR
jgi:excinuclease ABC subunit A